MLDRYCTQLRFPHIFILTFALLFLGSTGVFGQVTYNGNGNTGFGGVLGPGSLELSDDGATVTVTFNKGGADFSDELVIYIDSKSGGVESTANFTDTGDPIRQAISGFNGSTRSTVNFPSGFKADYAIGADVASSGFAGLWELVENGSHTFLSSVGISPSSDVASSTYTLSFDFSQIATSAGPESFSFVVTYLNSGSTFRSDEAIGDGIGSGNPGENSVSFDTYFQYSSGSEGGAAVTAQEGNWSDVSTWANGNVPLTEDAVTIDHDVTLDQDATLSSLAVNSGNTVTGSGGGNIITLTNQGMLTNNGTFDAIIEATRTVNNPSSGVNVAGLGAVINTSANLGDVTVTRGHTVQQNGGGNSSIERYYDINPSQNNSGLSATLTFNYADSELNGLTEGDLTFFTSDDGGTSWTQAGFDSRDVSANTVTLSGIQSFSRWTLGSESNPLPVELTTFEARQSEDGAALQWTTASETNNSGFAVQHAEGEGSFERTGWVDGSGTTTETQNYRFSVDDLSAGTHRFRLKQVDLDGSAHYSEVNTLTIRPEGPVAIERVSPHPVQSTSTVRLTARESGPVTVALYDVLGRRVETVHDGQVSANQPEQFTINAGSLSAGTYFLRVTGESFTESQRITVAP